MTIRICYRSTTVALKRGGRRAPPGGGRSAGAASLLEPFDHTRVRGITTTKRMHLRRRQLVSRRSALGSETIGVGAPRVGSTPLPSLESKSSLGHHTGWESAFAAGSYTRPFGGTLSLAWESGPPLPRNCTHTRCAVGMRSGHKAANTMTKSANS